MEPLNNHKEELFLDNNLSNQFNKYKEIVGWVNKIINSPNNLVGDLVGKHNNNNNNNNNNSLILLDFLGHNHNFNKIHFNAKCWIKTYVEEKKLQDQVN